MCINENVTKKTKNKFWIECVIDFIGYIDYYSGHGHAFAPKNLVACIRFGVPITYRETVQDILDGILDDINSTIEPIEFLTDNKELQEEIRNFVTDNVLTEAFKNALKPNTKMSDNFFLDDIEIIDEEEEIYEYPYLIGYYHIYLDEE